MKKINDKNTIADSLENSVLDIIDNEPDNIIAGDDQENCTFANLEDDFGSIADNDFPEEESQSKQEDFSKLADSPEFPADIESN